MMYSDVIFCPKWMPFRYTLYQSGETGSGKAVPERAYEPTWLQSRQRSLKLFNFYDSCSLFDWCQATHAVQWWSCVHRLWEVMSVAGSLWGDQKGHKGKGTAEPNIVTWGAASESRANALVKPEIQSIERQIVFNRPLTVIPITAYLPGLAFFPLKFLISHPISGWS